MKKIKSLGFCMILVCMVLGCTEKFKRDREIISHQGKLFQVKLKNEKKISGGFIFVVGWINQKNILYYRFYAQTNKGIRIVNVKAKAIRIFFEDKKNPYWRIKTMRVFGNSDNVMTKAINEWESYLENGTIINLYIPSESLKMEFDINIK